ncbi:N-6 DNA methylase, partial [Clostridium sp.]|uniref:Eco57I restriction-modification methylase domain-containing protein n=1 Tax=Clostridium sp. TaxID=1506 RepID=UPI0026337121
DGFIIQLNKVNEDIEMIEKGVIKAFLFINKIEYSNSILLCEYLSGVDKALFDTVLQLIEGDNTQFKFNELIEIFEMLLPKDESRENGMVYTPKKIKDYIIKNTLLENEDVKEYKICDPACGCGSFIFSISKYIHDKYKVDYRYIFENIIYGIDIIEHNIIKSKILLVLLALTDGEVINDDIFNIYQADSLELDWNSKFPDVFNKGGFTHVIGNPPYVRAKNINEHVKKNLKKWDTLKVGTADLYIPFYELGLTILRSHGKLGYISTNTFLSSLNGRELRRYLKDRLYKFKIVDFKDYQIFKKVRSYTCISIISKQESNVIEYTVSNDINRLYELDFSIIQYSSLPDKEAWSLVVNENEENINNILNVGASLGERYSIKNGIATLKNDLYIFTPVKEDNKFYYLEKNGVAYRIEKDICRDIVKPNIIKTEDDLIRLGEKAIFPYRQEDGKIKVISEEKFCTEYPEAYQYLCDIRPELAKRAKGESEQLLSVWYEYGRSQGLNNDGQKIFVPYMAGEPIAVLANNPKTLFYCGYAVYVEDESERIIIKKLLLSEVFWYFIIHTSKPYSKGYMSLAKNYIKNFGIPDLTEEQKEFILNEPMGETLNLYINNIYRFRRI